MAPIDEVTAAIDRLAEPRQAPKGEAQVAAKASRARKAQAGQGQARQGQAKPRPARPPAPKARESRPARPARTAAKNKPGQRKIRTERRLTKAR